MVTGTRQDIQDRQDAIAARKRERALVNDRLRQPAVAVVTASISPDVVVLFDFEMLRAGFLEHPKQPLRVDFVLFLAVDAQRVVRRRPAKQVARIRIGRVDVAARIDEQRHAFHVIFEAEEVVVLVVAEPGGAHNAVRDDQVVATPAHHRHPRARKVLQAIGRRRFHRRDRHGIEAPPGGFPWGPFAAARRPFTAAQDGGRGSEQVPRILGAPVAVAAQDMQPAVVGVSDLRHEAVRPLDGCKIADHLPQAVAHVLGKRRALEVGQAGCTEKQFGDQAMIRNRGLVVRSVRQHLHVHFRGQPGAALPAPRGAARQVVEGRGDEEQPDDVAEKVIAGHLVGILEMTLDEGAVIEEGLVSLGPEVGRQRGARAHQVETNRPVRRPQRDVHRTAPVHRGADRVGLHEVAQLTRDLHREAIVARQAVRLAEERPMLAPRQLPRQLDVGPPGAHPVKVPLGERNAGWKAQP